MRLYPINIALCLSIALGVLAWRTDTFTSYTYETDRRRSVEAQPVELSDWSLQNSDGELVNLADLSNDVLLVDFVYTRCPTICRALGSRYEQLQQTIKTAGLSHVSLLSISIDPTFDTPARLNLYQARYTKEKDSWHLARPVDDETLQLMISETGLRVIPDEFGGFVHSEAIHLINNGLLTKIESWDSPEWERLIRDNKKS